MRPPILTYLGHVLAHPSDENHVWDLVTNQLRHDLAAYKKLPLSVNPVLIPR